MTLSIRRQILDVVAQRVTDLGLATVHRNLDKALSSKRFPAIAIISGEDSSEPMTAGRGSHLADVEIHILVADTTDPELTADGIEVPIHAALFADVRMGSLANGETPLQRMGATWNFETGSAADRTIVYRFGFRTSITHLEQSA